MSMHYRTFEEARIALDKHRPLFAEQGIALPESVKSYLWDGAKRDYTLALDAQPPLSTDPNSALPSILTTFIDPEPYEILFSPVRIAEIIGEKKEGDWLYDTTMFFTVEHTGEVSSYGDYAENGYVGVNFNYPQRQNYLFQAFKEYGQRELERAGLARLNYVNEKDKACATIMKRFLNLSYAFGINGLQSYGLLNDPNLSASLSPAPKAAGGTAWIQNGVIVATANEVYNDIQSLFLQLISQTAGIVDKDTQMVLAMSPESAVALTATNSFNVNVEDLLKKNFRNLKVETAVQYGAITSTNPQGIAAGNLVQLIAVETEGQRTGFAAFSEKQKAFKIVVGSSSYKQKVMSGTWGTVLRMPVNISSMVGV